MAVVYARTKSGTFVKLPFVVGGAGEIIIGEDGGTFTPHISEDGILSWTNDKGLENPPPIKIVGDDGRQGDAGRDGVSCTHSWDGTVLTVKSASGESSVDLRGEQGKQGIQGERGEPFTIAKVYESVAQMNADYNNPDVGIGSFVMIVSNTDDEDNAKLYSKGKSEYVYIADLSGMQGIQGPQGIQGIQGVPGGRGADGVSATHSWNGTILTITSAYGTSSADLKGDKGDKGDPGPAASLYRGTNPLSSLDKDTRQFWAEQGGGYWWIAGNGNLKDQPNSYGFLLNMCYGTGEGFQMFCSSSTGAISVRSGGAGASNADGWYRNNGGKMWREVAFADMIPQNSTDNGATGS